VLRSGIVIAPVGKGAYINSIHKPPALFSFKSMSRVYLETVEPSQLSSRWRGGL